MAAKRDVPTAVVVVDPDGLVSGWSEEARLLLGWTAKDTVGRPLADLTVSPPPPGFPDGYGAGSDASRVVALRHRDGSPVEVLVTAHPLTGSEGTLGHAVTVQRWGRRPVIADLAFEQCPFALGVYDPDLRFLWINASSGRVIAHSEEQLLGKRYREVLPEVDRTLFPERDDKPYTDKLSEVARTGEPARLMTVFQPRGSSYATAWATSIWPVRDAEGRVRAVANWGFDMSAEYWARQRLLILNEAGGGIGRTLDVIDTARELAATSVPRFVDHVGVDLFDEVMRGEEPPSVSAFAPDEAIGLSRAAQGSVGDDAGPPPGPTVRVTHAAGSVAARCVITGRSTVELAAEPGEGGEWAFGPGLAADPAHWPPGNPVIDESLAVEGLTGRITVPLRARGALLGVVTFSRSRRPEAFTADDLILAEELTAKAAVAIDNARRYSHERTTALTLQRSLLPQGLPNQEAVEVAFRYLPGGAGAEVGGDWFDVIPLSGARVALVVGDVVGHGLHASAGMGRLRTAVRTLADVDLPPDELLTHLDDLVLHLGGDLRPDGHFQPTGESGATCLYAVYDPVSRRLTVASAGHPLPLVIAPDGTAAPVPVHPGPPLGIGGLPFESAELELPEGSLLALYTDGLLESREHDVDERVAQLRRALDHSVTSLEALCDTVIDVMLPERRTDDAALLLARTHVLARHHVADWQVSPDPGQVPLARKFAVEQVDAWGLEEAAFVTELVVSELVTNAIRYGEPPIRLRLIRDSSLICEVSDSSSTAPHLRRARAFDEGGRGLLLVAQLTQGWGARHTADGKTIWCAQALPQGRDATDG
ncbi:SpoIIE family protein phosphatase [Streptomyces sp. NPDC048481]|uniref:ATP-binding SpoIIE family protein phosphatase n=1 Tax=Streptomyces sp. NPDC048481 TaxID=3365557 RepID=UPI003712076D